MTTRSLPGGHIMAATDALRARAARRGWPATPPVAPRSAGAGWRRSGALVDEGGTSASTVPATGRADTPRGRLARSARLPHFDAPGQRDQLGARPLLLYPYGKETPAQGTSQ